MTGWNPTAENINDMELFGPNDEQLLKSQAPLPTGTLPMLDALADGLRGVTLIRGAPDGDAGGLAVQIGVDAMVNNATTCLLLFCCQISELLPLQLTRWHGSRYDDTSRARLLISKYTAVGETRIPEFDLRHLVAYAREHVHADRAIVILDDLYRYRRPPKRRTHTHRLADYDFLRKTRDAQRTSGDAWVIVADYDMQGCVDHVIECAPRSPSSSQVELAIRNGETRDLVGQIRIAYNARERRYKELSTPESRKKWGSA